MRILFIGDIIGRPGRRAVKEAVPGIRGSHNIDLVVANGENAAGGIGITPKVCDELGEYVDIITSGNHIWAKKEIIEYIKDSPLLLRPVNFPPGSPGRGYVVRTVKNGKKVGIINAVGRVFMQPLDCPFRTTEKVVAEISKETNIILVDFHAEATSEKQAMGWFLDGKVTAVLGTHTHVPTADHRILPGGTAYITDVGMTGARNGIIGMKKEDVLSRFLTQMPARLEPAKDEIWINAALIIADEETGKAIEVEPIRFPVK